MLQYRRTLVIILIVVSGLYFHTHHSDSISPDYSSSEWARVGHRIDGDSALNDTLGFAEIFVINLPSRRDRRNAMMMAGAVSNLNLNFLDALAGGSVQNPPLTGKVTDKYHTRTKSSVGARGSWRSHMSAMQLIVARGLGSALVLEDDVDWDVRLKAQTGTFARAARLWLDVRGEKEKRERVSRARSQKTADSRLGKGRLKITVSEEEEQRDLKTEFAGGSGSDPEADYRRAMEENLVRDTIPLPPDFPSSSSGHRTRTGSPYGDGWDVLWLGHCGADLPTTQREFPSSHVNQPSPSPASSSLIISISNDTTVPAPKHLKPHPFALQDKLAEVYPAHTRVVHAVHGNVCSLAYAVSQRGARKILRRFQREGFVTQWDLMLRDFCMGKYENEDTDGGTGHGSGNKGWESVGEGVRGKYGALACLTVQPPLISHYYAGEEGASVSNIRGQGGGLARGKKGTPYVRLSVQENLKQSLAGAPLDRLVDQLPNDGDPLFD